MNQDSPITRDANAISLTGLRLMDFTHSFNKVANLEKKKYIVNMIYIIAKYLT